MNGKEKDVADEQGQAVEQPAIAVPTELTPQQAVNELSQAIQKADTPRDETGKFAPKQKAEEAPEAAAEEPAEEAPEEEAPPPPRKLKIKYKGEDREVDEPEAVELAQKGYDYTQKMQQLSKERDESAASVKAERAAAAKQYEEYLETHKKAITQIAGVKTFPEIEALSKSDPVAAQQEFLRAVAVNQTISEIEAQQTKLRNERQSEMQSAQRKQAQEAVEILQSDIPGWSNDLYGKVLKNSVKDYGFKEQEVNSITDHRAIKVLHDAMKWREFQAAKPKTVDKKVASVPKVQKPGTTEKPDPKAQDLKVSFDQLTKTGSRLDAEAHVLALLKAGRL
jgi:hypothetical protein